MTPTTEKPGSVEDRFTALFDLLDGSMPNGNNVTLKELRKEAIDQFVALGLPNRKTESWKYTAIEKRLSPQHTIYYENRSLPINGEDLKSILVPGIDAHLVVTLNGRYVAELSSIKGIDKSVTLTDLKTATELQDANLFAHLGAQADHSEDPFVALNTAFLRDGLFLHVPAKTHVDKPIYLVHLLDAENDTVVQPRSVFMAGVESDVSVIEHYYSINEASHFINAVSEWVVDRQAAVRRYEIQDVSRTSSVVSNLFAYQDTHSIFSTYTCTLKGGLIRNNLLITPDAEECESHLFGFVLGTGTMHVDNHTLVDHKKPNCFSNELYKSILDEQSSGVFNGKVLVRPDAQKTNAYQSNKSITLTEKAKMYSKPELEIYADDVKCSHGATTGQLDAEALFYLRSRGLNEKKARSMLLQAFARDVIDAIEIDALRDYVDDRIANSL